MPTTSPITLSAFNATLLPPTITGPIFAKATEQSAVQQLARRVPLAIGANTAVPVPMDIPTADWVDQAGRKPLSTTGIDVRVMTGKKVACLVPVAEEVATTNAAGLYDQLEQDLPTALARAFDAAAIHGKTMRGATGPFTNYLADTSKEVVLGTATTANGGLWNDLVTGMQLVVNDNWDFTGFAADPRLKPQVLLAHDTVGRPIFVDSTSPSAPAGTGQGTLIGEPVYYNRGVSGKLNRQSTSTDTGVRAIGGDWSQCAYGVGMDITMRISREATYVDEAGGVHSAFQENLVLLLIEAIYGFVMGEPEAFVRYVQVTGETATRSARRSGESRASDTKASESKASESKATAAKAS